MNADAGTSTTTDLLSRLLLTREETAELLTVPATTIDNLHRTGQLCGVKVGKHLRWTPAVVRQYVDQLHAELLAS